jgi:putative SOS response-associated peptidase YedK
MCYDVAYLTHKAKKYAKHYGTNADWEDIKKRLPATYHASGFDEPGLPALTAEHPGVVSMNWPFIPPVFAPAATNGRPLNTLNARDDKIFTKSSLYYQAAQEKRCIIVLDGFFDHHHKNGVAYPHYVQLANDEPLFVAGLWQAFEKDEVIRECATLVTTRANKEMAWIHNEPAYSPESRMIAVLGDREAWETWMHGTVEEAKAVIQPLPDGALSYHSCHAVRSNKKLKRIYPGNVPAVQERVYYPDLEETQGSLF